MKIYKKPNFLSYNVEFEDILETSLSDLDDSILDFDANPDEIV